MLSRGELPDPLNPEVELAESRLQFSWDEDLENEANDEKDQVMLVAYFPQTFQAMTVESGALRTAGKHEIILPTFKVAKIIETYMALFLKTVSVYQTVFT